MPRWVEGILWIVAAVAWRAAFAVLSHGLRASAFRRVRNMPTRASHAAGAVGMIGFLAILLLGLVLAIRSRGTVMH